MKGNVRIALPPAELVSVLTFTVLQQGAMFGTRPLISLWLSDLGASLSQIGVVASLFGLGSMAVSVFVGRLIDSRGAGFMARVGCALMAFAYLVPVLVPSLWSLGACNLLVGIGFVCTVLSSQSIVAEVGSPGQHAQNYGYFATAVAVSQLVAPPLFGLMWDRSGHSVPFYVGVALSLGAMAVISAREKASPSRAGRPAEQSLLQSASALLRMPVLSGAILSGALVQFCQDSLHTFFPLYARTLGMSATATGLVFSVRSIAQLIIRPFLAVLVATVGRGRLLIASLVLGGLFSITLGIFKAVPVLLLAALVAGLAIGLAQPLTMSAVAEIAPVHLRGIAFSLRMTGNRLGQMVSPLILGAATASTGPAVAIWLSGAALSLGALTVSGPLSRALGKVDEAQLRHAE